LINVLSEATAGLEFGYDERQNIVWVDEMDTKQAEVYGEELHTDVSDADLNRIFDKVGKHPLKTLRSMTALKNGISAAQIIEDAVLAAYADLVVFTPMPILDALKASPDGIHVSACIR
jgi:hypothetical protein